MGGGERPRERTFSVAQCFWLSLRIPGECCADGLGEAHVGLSCCQLYCPAELEPSGKGGVGCCFSKKAIGLIYQQCLGKLVCRLNATLKKKTKTPKLILEAMYKGTGKEQECVDTSCRRAFTFCSTPSPLCPNSMAVSLGR